MNENHLKVVVPIVLLLPVALLFVFMMRGRQIPENHPLMTIITSNVDGVKVVEMTDEEFKDFGSSEAAFLIARMFNDPTEYKFFPLAQKKGELLNIIPEKQSDINPQASFSIVGATTRRYFEIENANQGETAKMVCIPSMRYTDMGRIAESNKYLQPKDFKYQGDFKYYFPYKINTSQWGTITYRCYLTGENPEINAALEEYMNSTNRPFLY